MKLEVCGLNICFQKGNEDSDAESSCDDLKKLLMQGEFDEK